MSKQDLITLLESHLTHGSSMYEVHNLADALCAVLTPDKLEQLVGQIKWNEGE